MNRNSSLVLIFFSLFILQFDQAFSQNLRKDSLQNFLRIAKEDTGKVNALNMLFLEYEFDDEEKAKEYLRKALELAMKIDYKKGLADSYTYLGYLESDKSNCRQAGNYFTQSLKISVELHDKKAISKDLCNLGNVSFEECDYPKALEYFFASLKISEELGNKRQIAAKLGNIGGVYIRQCDFPKAMDYFLRALKIDEGLGDKKEISPDLNNIGIVYYYMHNYPKALEYSFRALKIDEELDNKNWIASRLGSIANVYSDMAENKKNNPAASDSLFNTALTYYFKALKVYDAQGNQSGSAIQLGNIGSVYATLKRYKEAEAYFNKVLAIDTVIGFRDHTQNTFLQLSVVNEQTHQPEKALSYYKQYVAIKDSVFNETKSKQITEMQTKYEVDKKEKELTILKKENQIAECLSPQLIGHFFQKGLLLKPPHLVRLLGKGSPFLRVCQGYTKRTPHAGYRSPALTNPPKPA